MQHLRRKPSREGGSPCEESRHAPGLPLNDIGTGKHDTAASTDKAPLSQALKDWLGGINNSQMNNDTSRCPFCQISNDRQWRLRDHFRETHLKYKKRTTLPKKDGAFFCPCCPKKQLIIKNSRTFIKHLMNEHEVEELLEEGVEMWVFFKSDAEKTERIVKFLIRKNFL
jgi:hypothetical protein